jgi:hypothetical protein
MFHVNTLLMYCDQVLVYWPNTISVDVLQRI